MISGSGVSGLQRNTERNAAIKEKGEKMETLHLREEYIKLGQALKASGLAGSGVEAKIVIQDGKVRVNGEIETRRGKKLVAGDKVEYNGEVIRIEP